MNTTVYLKGDEPEQVMELVSARRGLDQESPSTVKVLPLQDNPLTTKELVLPSLNFLALTNVA
ncbi:hypothetical protein [Trichormus azollae]|uniref:hypothetical protein n=1 Tax=Trichormus azollae TaxID=1164 RepID=UPI00325DF641